MNELQLRAAENGVEKKRQLEEEEKHGFDVNISN